MDILPPHAFTAPDVVHSSAGHWVDMPKRVRWLAVAAVTIVALLATSPIGAQVNITTQHYDNARTGANLHETVLAAANVNSGQFGRLYSVALYGQIYAQPLNVFTVEEYTATNGEPARRWLRVGVAFPHAEGPDPMWKRSVSPTTASSSP